MHSHYSRIAHIIYAKVIVALFGPTLVCPHIACVLGVFASYTMSHYITAPAWFYTRMKFKNQHDGE